MWKRIAIEKTVTSSVTNTSLMVSIPSQSETQSTAANTISLKSSYERILTKEDIPTAKAPPAPPKINEVPNENNITKLLQRKKESFSQSMKSVNEMTKLFKKAQHDVDVFVRSIQICINEIENHCCTCGGIHVFSDHEPTKMLSCKRLKAKNRSLMYLKKAKRDASERMMTYKAGVKQCEREKEEARRSLSLLLKESLFAD